MIDCILLLSSFCNPRRVGIPLTAAAFGATALLACGGPARELEIEGALERAEQPILRGTRDTEHFAVMTLVSEAGFLCSGTVIAADEQHGYLLTAAHCVTEERGAGLVTLPARSFVVVPGADFAEALVEYPVDAVNAEPSYDGSFAADVAVVRFAFGNDSPPSVITPLSKNEDALAVADELLLVGFGQTDSDDDNTERRQVARQLRELDEELLVYSQEDGKGACFGDSGGPVLVTLGREERLAAVISGGVDAIDDGCAGGLGVAMRVSAYEDFIQGELTRAG